MAKKRSKDRIKETKGQEEGVKPKDKKKLLPTRNRKLPNWPLLGLSLAGMALAGYLSLVAWLGDQPLYCNAGSSCDVVQSSRWGSFLGLPIAFWGFLTYAALGHVAFRVKNVLRHWKLTWLLAIVGLAVSLYLTAVSLLVIEAACLYCLASLTLMTAIFVVVTVQAPRGLEGFSWRGWLLESGGMAAVVVVMMHLHYSGVFSAAAGPEDPYLKALAEHLTDTGAKFYGASWCTACAAQKEMFKASVRRLPYVECSPNGRNAPRAAVCIQEGVSSYPTWEIGGEKSTGVIPPQDLARLSNFIWHGQPR